MKVIGVDIGNSATKIMFGDQHWRCPHDPSSECLIALKELKTSRSNDGELQPCLWSIVSVNEPRCEQLKKVVADTFADDVVWIVGADDVPLKTHVKSRHQLGRDRLVAAYSALELNRGATPLIVVDAGTAVTIDVVHDESYEPRTKTLNAETLSAETFNAENRPVFLGGLIFPGASLNLQSLHASTDQLPSLHVPPAPVAGDQSNIDQSKILVGDDTASAIVRGVTYAQAHAVLGIVQRLQDAYPSAVVYGTGGGMKSIISALPVSSTKTWQTSPRLVLLGALQLGKTQAASL